MKVICGSGENVVSRLTKTDNASIVDIIQEFSKKIPDAEINIIELLSDCSKEIPNKKTLILANTVNEVFGGSKTIVSGIKSEKDFDEICISSICGSSFDTYIINFIGKNDSAQMVLSDSFSYFTFN